MILRMQHHICSQKHQVADCWEGIRKLFVGGGGDKIYRNWPPLLQVMEHLTVQGLLWLYHLTGPTEEVLDHIPIAYHELRNQGNAILIHPTEDLMSFLI